MTALGPSSTGASTHDDLVPWRALRRSGLSVPAVGLGCWAIGGPDYNLGLPMGWSTAPADDEAVAGLEAAYAVGVRLFDTADVYGHGRSERLIGRLVAQVPRDDLVLVSKVGYFAGTAEHGYAPGHMRHQLEQTLTNLNTDHVDIYFLHHSDFGDHDQWLPGVVRALTSFKAEGLIRAVGMRGPHRFTLDRLPRNPDGPVSGRADKVTRFRELFPLIDPDVLAVRDNLLTPPAAAAGLFAFADEAQVGVLVNKPLAQGLLTGAHTADSPRTFGSGDHRSRKRWFTAGAQRILDDGLHQVRVVLGAEDPAGQASAQVIRAAIWSCLDRSPHAVALVGFTSAAQVRQNLAAAALGPLPENVLAQVRDIMSGVQRSLDASGEVFLDEVTSPTAPTPGGAS